MDFTKKVKNEIYFKTFIHSFVLSLNFRITFTYEIAKTIEDFVETRAKYTRKGLELSLFIYSDIKCALEPVICMIKLGRIKAALHHIKANAAKLKPNVEFYLKLLQKCPELEFANALSEVKTFYWLEEY